VVTSVPDGPARLVHGESLNSASRNNDGVFRLKYDSHEHWDVLRGEENRLMVLKSIHQGRCRQQRNLKTLFNKTPPIGRKCQIINSVREKQRD